MGTPQRTPPTQRGGPVLEQEPHHPPRQQAPRPQPEGAAPAHARVDSRSCTRAPPHACMGPRCTGAPLPQAHEEHCGAPGPRVGLVEAPLERIPHCSPLSSRHCPACRQTSFSMTELSFGEEPLSPTAYQMGSDFLAHGLRRHVFLPGRPASHGPRAPQVSVQVDLPRSAY